MKQHPKIFSCTIREVEGLVKGSEVLPENVFVITRTNTLEETCKKHGYTWLNSLAPSWGLFKATKEYKKNNEWTKETFKERYRNRYIKELMEPDKIKILNDMLGLLKSGNSICLVCFCPDETYCHRTIVKETLDKHLEKVALGGI